MSACHGTKSKFGKIWENWENMGKYGKINDILGKKMTLWESGKEVGKVGKMGKVGKVGKVRNGGKHTLRSG